MNITDRGLLALVRHEGIVPGPYLDVRGSLDLRHRPHGRGGGTRSGQTAPRHARRPGRGDPRGVPDLPRRSRALRGGGPARRDRAARTPRVRCAGQLSLQHRRHRSGRADPPPERRRSGRRGRGLPELAATGGDRSAPRGRARSLPARPLSGGHDPGLERRSRRAGGVLPPDPAAHGDRGPRAAAPGRRARARRTRDTDRLARAPHGIAPPSSSEGSEPCAICDHPP